MPVVVELQYTVASTVTVLEKDARQRKWVSFAEAVRLVAWKEELSQALLLSSLAPSR